MTVLVSVIGKTLDRLYSSIISLEILVRQSINSPGTEMQTQCFTGKFVGWWSVASQATFSFIVSSIPI